MDNQTSAKSKIMLILKRTGIVLLVTILAFLVLVIGVVFIMEMGPSPTAKELFVRSTNETSALKFMGKVFLSENEVAAILSQNNSSDADLNAQLYELKKEDISAENSGDIWSEKDTDGDGIIIEEVKGGTYTGYMMIVKDPMRVQLAIDQKYYGAKARYVEEYCEMFDAVAGVNGGGFEDENGQGSGAIADSVVVFEGKFYSTDHGTKNAFIGIDDKGVMHVEYQDTKSIENANIRYGCSYGPLLVKDGKVVDNLRDDWSGLNPRTAVGQREDGSILLLVIDGRHVVSLGAQYSDLANIMIEYGAVCAANMDGGSSTAMIFNGERLNNKAAVLGARPCPNAWIVLKEGETSLNSNGGKNE